MIILITNLKTLEGHNVLFNMQSTTSNLIIYNNILCLILKSWKDPEWDDQHHEVLYKNEIKILYESSMGIGEVKKDKIGLLYLSNQVDTILIVFNIIEKIKHRDKGPARIDIDGKKVWYKNGYIYRDDGPSIIRPDGSKVYWSNGKEYSSFKELRKNLNKCL